MSLTTKDLLGPLTTVWTPPAPCLATATYNPSAIWAPDASKSALSPAILLGATGQAVDLVCYPPKYTVNHLYSPGVCPSGWTSACEPTSGFGSKIIAAPTTGVQCCPTGMRCSHFLWCIQEPTATARPIWSLWTDTWGIEGVLTSTSFPTLKVLAKPIFVAYQSSDQSLLAAATQGAASNDSIQPVGTGSQAPTPQHSLSGGTIAGIVVGSAAGGILLATILTFVFLRFCFGYRRMQSRNSESAMRGDAKQVELDNSLRNLSPNHPSTPNQGGWSATELDSTGHATDGRAELADRRESKQ